MKKFYFPLMIVSLILGSCSQELPSVPGKNQATTETPDPEPTTPETPDYKKLNTLLGRLNLDDANLFRVKAALNANDSAQAQKELLRYFRERTALRGDVKHPSVQPENKPTQANLPSNKPADGVLKQANDGLSHIFLAQKKLDPIDYGTDIDWGKHHSDIEVMYQVHRMYWWAPMGQTYWYSLDEKYAKEWIFQVKDWMKKNPCEKSSATFKYAWRPLEIASRLSDQPGLFNYFVTSENFTPEFLVEFLNSFYEQADYLWNNFPWDNGNHLIYSGNGCYTAGCFFPEFKESATWRTKGVELLKQQLDAQVTEDGVQNEYTPKYQAGTISEFLSVTDFARLNGRESDFPQAYMDKIRKMIDVIINLSVVTTNDQNKLVYQMPMFGDTEHLDGGLTKYFTTWLSYYPNDKVLETFSKGGNGDKPAWTSAIHSIGGFYTFRNGWTGSNVMMPITIHPEQVWHSHPDLGTFELSLKGRLIMPDAGFYKYEGDQATMIERNLFRRSCIHKIMTLDNKDIAAKVQSTLWSTALDGRGLQGFSFENQSYSNMSVTRTIFFQSKASPYPYFVIIDEGIGNATGKVQVHFNVCENANVTYDATKKQMYTGFTDRNILIQSFCPASTSFTLKEITGNDARISYKYGTLDQGSMVSFETNKAADENIQIVTVLFPFDTPADMPEITNIALTGSGKTLKVTMDINGTSSSFQMYK